MTIHTLPKSKGNQQIIPLTDNNNPDSNLSKIFRVLKYVMRRLMKEDHKFYKRERLYDDFPQRQKNESLNCK